MINGWHCVDTMFEQAQFLGPQKDGWEYIDIINESLTFVGKDWMKELKKYPRGFRIYHNHDQIMVYLSSIGFSGEGNCLLSELYSHVFSGVFGKDGWSTFKRRDIPVITNTSQSEIEPVLSRLQKSYFKGRNNESIHE